MKILWGFEPFHQDKAAIKGMHHLLLQFAQNPNRLELGYIVTGNESILGTAFDVPDEERFTSYPKKLILDNLRKAAISINEKNVHIISYQTLSTTKSVDRFLEFGKSRQAQLLAIYTHGKQGLERFVLGSFAETAIHRSKIPLLVVNPRSKFTPRISSLLYASNFSAHSKKDLSRVLRLCKQLNAHLTVFHAAEILYTWSLDESNPKVHAYRRRIKRMEKEIKNAANKAEVDCDVIISSEFDAVPPLVLKAARKSKANLIVVTAKVGPIAALMGGSVTRQLVRNGAYPVLVLKK